MEYLKKGTFTKCVRTITESVCIFIQKVWYFYVVRFSLSNIKMLSARLYSHIYDYQLNIKLIATKNRVPVSTVM